MNNSTRLDSLPIQFIIIVLLLTTISVSAQYITGPSTVNRGSKTIHTYYPPSGTIPFNYRWEITGDQSYRSLGGYSIEVTWSNYASSGLIKFVSFTGNAQQSVTIVAPPPPPPPPVVTNTKKCGLGTLTMVASGAPYGGSYRWYNSNNVYLGSGQTRSTTFSFSLGNPIQERIFYVSTYKNGVESAKTQVTARSYPLPSSVSAGADSTFCITDSFHFLQGYPSGGTWSGNGVFGFFSSYYFSPGTATSGQHTLTYTYTNQYGCSRSDTKIVTVRELPIVYAGEDLGLFKDGGRYNLSRVLGITESVQTNSFQLQNNNTTSVGIWSGNGVVEDGPWFNPSIVNGTSVVTYTYSDGYCSNSDNRIITTYDPPEITYQGDLVLTDDEPTEKLSSNQDYPSYQWYKDNIPISGAINKDYILSEPGNYSLKITLQGGTTRFTDPVVVYKNSDLVNYVRVRSVQQEGFMSELSVQQAPVSQVKTVTNYLDYMGRALQSVTKQFSPQKKDLVTVATYDQFGRQTIKYLPYVASYGSGAFKQFDVRDLSSSPQYLFYQNTTDKIANTKDPWSKSRVEASPLNRVIEQGAVGEDWQLRSGHTIRMDYATNSDLDDIPIWVKTAEGLKASKKYDLNTLTLNQTTNENGHLTRTFTDKRGNKLLEETEDGRGWRNINYVFDSKGRMTYVIPPQTMDMLVSSYPKFIPNTVLEQECYRYEYDYRDRVIVKQLPGAAPIFMVYDRWDRLVLSQDGNQRINDQWSFTKYDALNRPVMTGVTVLSGDRAFVQQQVDQFYDQVQVNDYLRYEELGAHQHGYTNQSFPTINAISDVILSVTYYDNYDFVYQPGWQGPMGIVKFIPELAIDEYLSRPKGKVTGTKINILGSQDYVYYVSFYDDKYRLIQSTSTNHLNGTDRYTTSYDFVGKVLQEKRTHQALNDQLIIHKEFTYDHHGRPLKTYHTINDGDKILLSDNQYNEIGELIEKNLHSTDNGANFLQSIDYRYNIRGWLKTINNPQLTFNPENNDDTNDLFGMELYYNDREATLNNSPSYNKNISAVTWKSAAQQEEQGYVYTYDRSNRLKTASYINLSDPLKNGRYSVGGLQGIIEDTGISYDKNGNILHLKRYGLLAGNTGVIDDLFYQYNGNQLISVDDSGDASLGYKTSGSIQNANIPAPNTFLGTGTNR
ncbi:DUF6443 domain-containing protein [Aquimarina brevivitae]|uniref:DUF6443 domain-containing protein n=1 Tax=Aquimarina brevivitae TaxID=323412 RepID=A0A4Q7PHX7_9FLAO|nr:DUF6443 domain-containing protein [Aquimarina brevivitae]RZS99558.1 hypothetical protein EV197_0780 [Aquimarina brevivitae]